MRCANDQLLLLLFLRLVAIILRPKRFTFNHILLSNVNLFDRLAFISFPSSFHFLQPQSMLKYGTGAPCLCNRILTEPRKKKWRCLLLWQYIYIIFFSFQVAFLFFRVRLNISSSVCNTNDFWVNKKKKTWRRGWDKNYEYWYTFFFRLWIETFFCERTYLENNMLDYLHFRRQISV